MVWGKITTQLHEKRQDIKQNDIKYENANNYTDGEKLVKMHLNVKIVVSSGMKIWVFSCINIIFIMRKNNGYKIKSQCKYRVKDMNIIQKRKNRNSVKHCNMFSFPTYQRNAY